MKIEKMTATQAEKALQEAEAAVKRLLARREEIKAPPQRTPVPAAAGIGSPQRDPFEDAGPEYRRVALEGTPQEMAALTREWQDLQAEATQLDHRRAALRQRIQAARLEEARAAAPRKARKLLEELPDIIDRVDDALEALADAMEAREGVLRELDAARALLADGDQVYFSPEVLRRVWASEFSWHGIRLGPSILRKMESTRSEALEYLVPALTSSGMEGQKIIRPALVKQARERLAPPPRSIVERLLSTFRKPQPGSLMEVQRQRNEEEALEGLARNRVRAICAGRLDDLDEAATDA